MNRTWVAAIVIFLCTTTVVSAARNYLVVPLMLRPELQLQGTEEVFVGPITLEPRSSDATHAVDLSAVREFERFLKRLIKRETRLRLLPDIDSLTLPTDDPKALSEDQEFWLSLGQETGAEYIISASVDVKVLDRAGYQTEEYISPTDGKTYFRQVMVEETGFSYDILLTVVNGKTGEVAHQEQITDFKQRSDRKLREFTDMYSDLYTLEDRLLGVFVPRIVPAKRYLHKR